MRDIDLTDTGDKVTSLSVLAKTVSGLKTQGLRVVHCHGVFDLVHPGHIRHLKEAREQGDVLVVTVTPDEYVNKGPGRPVFNHRLRAESLAALQCVDFVAVNEWPTAVETIAAIKPSVYVKGAEYESAENDVTGKIALEETAIRAVGGRIHFTDGITFSSSQLLNDHFSVLSVEAEDWLRKFRARRTADEVLTYLDAVRDLKVLVVGEAIVDEYVFCDGLGKSTKDPILAFQYRNLEQYGGGSIAVANHVAGLCDKVGLITFLGESERSEEFIRNALHSNVQPSFLTQHGAPTIHKRRFVDDHTGARLFEVYVMQDGPLAAQCEADLLTQLREQIENYDVVIVSDYGHGMLGESAVRELTERAAFLAVNTQANAGNRGFNTVTKYPRADYVCLAMHEIALETRLRHAGWRDLVLEVIKRIDCPHFSITQGKSGSLHYTLGSDFTEVPALATKVTDRVGAGDAVLAVTSLLVAQGAPWDVVGFLGNIAGAQMVNTLGNRVTVDRSSLARHVLALMK